MYVSAKTGENVNEAFQMLCDNIYKHNLSSVTKYVGWGDDANTQHGISEASEYMSMQSFYERGSIRLTKNAHVLKNESVYSGIDRSKKTCKC